jgi:3-oxoacyl-[acyl-carrier-protein] synthase II
VVTSASGNRRRIAITGLGIVAPHGNEPVLVFDALCRGRSAVAFDDGLQTVVACATLDDVDGAPGSRKRQSGVDRVSQFALAAGASALADAGWSRDARLWDAERSGIYVGTGFGGTAAIGEAVRRFHVNERIPPLSVVAGMANAAAAHLAIRTGFTGPVLTYSVACASSSVAIAAGAKDIMLGEIDVALVGGAEAPLVASMVASWHAMHTLASVREDDAGASCRPFSASRTGLALGEGAAFLVLEDFDAARARGARIYAELAGTGTACDANHLTKPEPDGQVRAMRAALRQAGIAPRDVGYCNAHGTATVVGDLVETRSITDLWGDDLPALRVSSTKALHGHMLGAAGAIEALVTTLALHARTLPPNAHCEDPDPACGLPLVGAEAEQSPGLQAAITNSFAFGGTNSSLVLRRVDA